MSGRVLWWVEYAFVTRNVSEGPENPPSHDSSEGGVCGGWNTPFVTRNVSGRVAVAMKSLRLTIRAREGSVEGGIPLRHWKCE